MYQHTYKRKKRDFTDPPPMEHLAELQEWLQDLFETVVETLDKQLLALYNKTANKYNALSGKIIFLNFQNPIQMATTKAAAAKKETAAAAPTPKTAAAKKAAATPVAPVAEEPAEKPLSQKETVIAEAEEGLSVNEIVEKHGFIKTNVSWYFSKHKLHNLPAQIERKANEAAEKAAAKAEVAAAVAATKTKAAPVPAASTKKAASAQKTK